MDAEAGRVIKLAAIIKTSVTKTPIIVNTFVFVSFLFNSPRIVLQDVISNLVPHPLLCLCGGYWIQNANRDESYLQMESFLYENLWRQNGVVL